MPIATWSLKNYWIMWFFEKKKGRKQIWIYILLSQNHLIFLFLLKQDYWASFNNPA